MKDELPDFLALALPDFDSILAERGTELASRPFLAASMVVEHCIVDIKGDTKDDYLTKSWFGEFYRATHRWYLARYGKALTDRGSRVVHGVVAIFGTPFALKVPLTVLEDCDGRDAKFWVCFPNSIMPNEAALDWVVAPPNIENFREEERAVIAGEIAEVAIRLRKISVNLMTADFGDELLRKLARSVIPHLEKGASDVARNQRELAPLALWEFHLAAEKAMKVCLRQRGVRPPNTHDLCRLHQLSQGFGLDVAARDSLAKLPTAKAAIRYRYAEQDPGDLSAVLRIYRASLELIDEYTKHLARRFTFNNAGFLLRAPPWSEEEA